MITVNYHGNSYLFSKSSNGGVWIGNGGPMKGRYPGLYRAAPMIIWPALTAAAIEAGTDKSAFFSPAKKETKHRVAKTTSTTIAIF